jgi:chorismate mutase/prephenate dehydratase
MKQVAYLGPKGTYSEIAARQAFDEAELVPHDSLETVVAAIESGEVQGGVLPIENSTEGSVHRTLDLLAQAAVTIQGELLLPIHHQLLGKGSSLDQITQVWAHPQALAQCRGWLADNLPHADQHAAPSNAAAAQFAASHAHAAAIASAEAADHYGLHVLAGNIEDDPHNVTRFVVVGKELSKPTGKDKTSLVCSLPHKAGSLYSLLGIFAQHNVNLNRLESRPLPEAVWEYLFYIDCDGHLHDPQVAAALKEAEAYAPFYKLLGSYPRTLEQRL